MPISLLKELLAQYEAWQQAGGTRTSIADPLPWEEEEEGCVCNKFETCRLLSCVILGSPVYTLERKSIIPGNLTQCALVHRPLLALRCFPRSEGGGIRLFPEAASFV